MGLGLRTKILAIFTVVGVLFGIVCLATYRNNILLTRAAESISSNFEMVEYANKLDGDIDNVSVAIENSVSRPGASATAEVFRTEMALVRRLGKLGGLAPVVTETRQAGALGRLAASTPAMFMNVAALSPEGMDLATADRHQREIERLSLHTKRLEHLSEGFLVTLGVQIAGSRRTQTLTLGLLALLALASAFLVAVFSSRVAQPLSQLGVHLRRAASGQMDALVPMGTGDEIEEAARSFNKLVSRLREEEALAATLQEKLLPSLTPSVPGLAIYATQRQARLVGGDWYDYHLMDGTLAFSVADSCGKGMAGALLSTVAMTALRSQAKTRGNLCAVLEQVNLAIESRLGGDKFVTLLTGYVDPRSGVVTLVNCGHEQPLVYRSATKAWEFLECASTMPLGISFEHFHPRQVDVPLAAGDRLLLYTDGLHDVRDRRRQFLEMPTVLSWMAELNETPIEPLIDDLLKRAVDYAQGDILDDITILGLEYSPVAAAAPHESKML